MGILKRRNAVGIHMSGLGYQQARRALYMSVFYFGCLGLFVTSSKEIFCATLLAGVILSCKLLWLLGAVDKFTSVAVRGEE